MNLNNFERLEREVERLVQAYAALKLEAEDVRYSSKHEGKEIAKLQKRISVLEEDKRLALEKIEQLLEQLNQLDL
jgi:FtsZ-binding cell division protein ZapB